MSPAEPLGPESVASLAARRPLVVVVTGLSGAGRTTSLHALEDLGFFCIDNLPTVLAPDAVSLCESGGMSRVALGIDVRVRAFLGDFEGVLRKLSDDGQRDVQVLFLDASDEAILRRFSETRRPHALATATGSRSAQSVLEGVTEERGRLAPLRARATRVIDTTRLSVHELRKAVIGQFGPKGGGERMSVRFVSFGFKYGTPVDVDLLFDVRFLRNPYFIEGMREQTGLDAPVRDFVLGLAETRPFLERTVSLLEFVVPMYEREGKAYLTIGVGCTGGRHRSVALAQELATRLVSGMETALGEAVALVHRDIDRDGAAQARKSVIPPPPDAAREGEAP